MSSRLPPLFESGTYGCPYCGSPDIEFRDFQWEERSFAIAGICHGLGEATAIHRFVIIMTMTLNGMVVRVEPLHRDVSLPGRPNMNGAPITPPGWSTVPGPPRAGQSVSAVSFDEVGNKNVADLIREMTEYVKNRKTEPGFLIVHPKDVQS